MVLAHAFNPSINREAEQEDFCECKATLVYRWSSRRARAVTHTHTKSGLVKLKMEEGSGQRHRMKMCS